MKYSLLTYPNPKLKTRCSSVDVLTDTDKEVIEEMKRVCLEHDGFALAANQIGYMRRIVVFAPYQSRNDWLVMINPVWTTRGNLVIPDTFSEGCLSFPSIRQKIRRWDSVHVDYQDENMTLVSERYDGIMSIAIQHECEHLDGKTFIDSLSQLKRNRILDKMRKLKD